MKTSFKTKSIYKFDNLYLDDIDKRDSFSLIEVMGPNIIPIRITYIEAIPEPVIDGDQAGGILTHCIICRTLDGSDIEIYIPVLDKSEIDWVSIKNSFYSFRVIRKCI